MTALDPMLSDDLAEWLFGEAMPLWLAHGVDWERRAFRETLDVAGLTCAAAFRRLYVTARQVYVFAEGERRGVPDAGYAVDLGLEFLVGHARQADGGYAWRFGLDNRVTDPARDLYDLSFVLFAFAKARRPERCRTPALDLVRFIQTVLTHPAGGWREADPARLPRRQNPHMHLLEATLSAYEAFGDGVFLKVADAVVELALKHFIDPRRGLCEYFDEELRSVLDDHGRYVTEPGHHYEWAWLLRRYRTLSNAASIDTVRLDAAAAALVRFADTHGISPHANAAIDEVWSSGEVASGKAKLWPQTERLKAALVWPEYAAYPASVAAEGLRDYLTGMPAGCWQEQRNEDGGFISQPMQASSLYHLTCAILEAEAHGL